ncbi:hypothetical protein [Virgibacillus sp. YIM 98842]|uniref:hypothetical protein n=1 Tax=Virgibacillus sp. YIM 98842 TaxID=2663533 RepID=UPI0013DC0392|nr:hypothetical protein [Virgibacillus sp. YIM 98842]
MRSSKKERKNRKKNGECGLVILVTTKSEETIVIETIPVNSKLTSILAGAKMLVN